MRSCIFLACIMGSAIVCAGCTPVVGDVAQNRSLVLQESRATRPAKDAKRQKESVCGSNIDWFEAEEFKGSKPVSRSTLLQAGRRTVRLVLKPAEVMRKMILKMFPGTKPEDVELGKYQQYASEGFCTGTLLNRSTVITAAHCFESGVTRPSIFQNDEQVQLRPDQLATLFEVQTGYQFIGGTRKRQQGSRSAVQRLREYGPDRSNALDYAIISIAPFESVGHPMLINSHKLPQDSAVAIVHHPLGLPKKDSVGMLDSYSGTSLYYSKADTEEASSGAGILDQNGKLIGIHTEGGCEKFGNNGAVSIAAIRSISAFLKNSDNQ